MISGHFHKGLMSQSFPPDKAVILKKLHSGVKKNKAVLASLNIHNQFITFRNSSTIRTQMQQNATRINRFNLEKERGKNSREGEKGAKAR